MKEIYQRRSIRKYLNKDISNEDLLEIVKAAQNAPSAHNKRPWEFIIIKDKEIINKIGDIKKSAFMLKEANAVIVMIANQTTDYWQQDMGAATQNILLSATSLKIGTCWIGIDLKDENTKILKEILMIPDDKYLFALISLGYPNEKLENNDEFDKNKIYYNKWGKQKL